MTISVILPTYNEKDNIIDLIKDLQKYLAKITNKYEIIVVDDNSPDSTGKICSEYYRQDTNVSVLIKKRNRGLASSILYGLKRAKGDYLIVMDTDFSHPPALIPQFEKKIKNCDIVIGSRYAKGGGGENKTRYFLSKIFNFYLKLLIRIKISDFLFGFFCIRRDFMIKNNLLRPDIFYGFGDYFIRLAFYISKHNGKFIEIPVFYKDRTKGKSKSNLLKMLITYTYTSLNLLNHP